MNPLQINIYIYIIMFTFNILTTAMIRNDVHKKGILNFMNLISKSENLLKVSNINLIINLDIMNINTSEEIDFVKKSLLYFQNDKIKIYISESKNPCFHEAFKRVFINTNTIINTEKNNIFVWLEDDWFISESHLKNIFVPNLIKFSNEKDIEFLLCFSKHPQGPPYCFKKNFFNNIIFVIKNKIKEYSSKTGNDPERIMQLVYFTLCKTLKSRKIGSCDYSKFPHLKNKPIPKNLLKIQNAHPHIFKDCGDKWKDENNLKKWNKGQKNGLCCHKKI